jgi:hypothetical protein
MSGTRAARGTSVYPRAVSLNQRAMEVYRVGYAADAIRLRSAPYSGVIPLLMAIPVCS